MYASIQSCQELYDKINDAGYQIAVKNRSVIGGVYSASEFSGLNLLGFRSWKDYPPAFSLDDLESISPKYIHHNQTTFYLTIKFRGDDYILTYSDWDDEKELHDVIRERLSEAFCEMIMWLIDNNHPLNLSKSKHGK